MRLQLNIRLPGINASLALCSVRVREGERMRCLLALPALRGLNPLNQRVFSLWVPHSLYFLTFPAHSPSEVEDKPVFLGCSAPRNRILFFVLPKQSIKGPKPMQQATLFPGIQRLPVFRVAWEHWPSPWMAESVETIGIFIGMGFQKMTEGHVGLLRDDKGSGY